MTKRAHWGMAMLLMTEAVFFFLLIAACAYLRALPSLGARTGWPLTALLIASCLAVWRGWRWAAVVLGAAFACGLFGTMSSMLTSVLGIFVIAGVVAMAVVPVRALRTMALYWYFCTAVWLVIFLVASQA
jgi:heme/copper-type cytochrome/quinol oxidase subunit 3